MPWNNKIEQYEQYLLYSLIDISFFQKTKYIFNINKIKQIFHILYSVVIATNYWKMSAMDKDMINS